MSTGCSLTKFVVKRSHREPPRGFQCPSDPVRNVRGPCVRQDPHEVGPLDLFRWPEYSPTGDDPIAPLQGLRHRGLRLKAYGENLRETLTESARANPPIQPESGGKSVPQDVFRPQAKYILDLLEGSPELGTRSVSVRQEVFVAEVLTSQNVGPQTLFPGI